MAFVQALPRMRRPRLSRTLSGYIARQYTFWFFSFFFALSGIILLVSVVDLVDRLATKNVSLAIIVEMVLLKLPYLSQEVMPFIILFAGMIVFWRLTRSHELVVTRAAGVSVWQFLLPVISVAVFIGIFVITVFNPIASVLLGRYEQLEDRYLRNQVSMLAVSRSGLWLRQVDGEGQSVIHAQRISAESMTLHEVIVFRFVGEDRFTSRIDAKQAELKDGFWLVHDAWLSSPSNQASFEQEIEIPTDLTQENILEGFAPPETISFWSLPSFITLLDEAGLSALRHRLQLHRLLAIPILFTAMILLAATFSLRTQRRGHIGTIILAGVLTGFLLYFLSNFVFALGLSAKIPVILAAWTPAGVSMMLGIATLLHLEDG